MRCSDILRCPCCGAECRATTLYNSGGIQVQCSEWRNCGYRGPKAQLTDEQEELAFDLSHKGVCNLLEDDAIRRHNALADAAMEVTA